MTPSDMLVLKERDQYVGIVVDPTNTVLAYLAVATKLDRMSAENTCKAMAAVTEELAGLQMLVGREFQKREYDEALAVFSAVEGEMAGREFQQKKHRFALLDAIPKLERTASDVEEYANLKSEISAVEKKHQRSQGKKLSFEKNVFFAIHQYWNDLKADIDVLTGRFSILNPDQLEIFSQKLERLRQIEKYKAVILQPWFRQSYSAASQWKEDGTLNKIRYPYALTTLMTDRDNNVFTFRLLPHYPHDARYLIFLGFRKSFELSNEFAIATNKHFPMDRGRNPDNLLAGESEQISIAARIANTRSQKIFFFGVFPSGYEQSLSDHFICNEESFNDLMDCVTSYLYGVKIISEDGVAMPLEWAVDKDGCLLHFNEKDRLTFEYFHDVFYRDFEEDGVREKMSGNLLIPINDAINQILGCMFLDPTRDIPAFQPKSIFSKYLPSYHSIMVQFFFNEIACLLWEQELSYKNISVVLAAQANNNHQDIEQLLDSIKLSIESSGDATPESLMIDYVNDNLEIFGLSAPLSQEQSAEIIKNFSVDLQTFLAFEHLDEGMLVSKVKPGVFAFTERNIVCNLGAFVTAPQEPVYSHEGGPPEAAKDPFFMKVSKVVHQGLKDNTLPSKNPIWTGNMRLGPRALVPENQPHLFISTSMAEVIYMLVRELPGHPSLDALDNYGVNPEKLNKALALLTGQSDVAVMHDGGRYVFVSDQAVLDNLTHKIDAKLKTPALAAKALVLSEKKLATLKELLHIRYADRGLKPILAAAEACPLTEQPLRILSLLGIDPYSFERRDGGYVIVASVTACEMIEKMVKFKYIMTEDLALQLKAAIEKESPSAIQEGLTEKSEVIGACIDYFAQKMDPEDAAFEFDTNTDSFFVSRAMKNVIYERLGQNFALYLAEDGGFLNFKNGVRLGLNDSPVCVEALTVINGSLEVDISLLDNRGNSSNHSSTATNRIPAQITENAACIGIEGSLAESEEDLGGVAVQVSEVDNVLLGDSCDGARNGAIKTSSHFQEKREESINLIKAFRNILIFVAAAAVVSSLTLFVMGVAIPFLAMSVVIAALVAAPVGLSIYAHRKEKIPAPEEGIEAGDRFAIPHSPLVNGSTLASNPDLNPIHAFSKSIAFTVQAQLNNAAPMSRSDSSHISPPPSSAVRVSPQGLNKGSSA